MSGEIWKKVVLVGVGIVAVLLLLIGLLLGLRTLKRFFLFLVVSFLILCILFALAWMFYMLFIKKRFKNIPHVFKDKLVSTMRVMKNDMLGDLYLSGDTKHNRISLGKYFYLRINLPSVQGKNSNNLGKDSTTEKVPIDCFIINRKGFINKLFSEPFFILVKPEDHDYSAIFNDVTIKGFNLVPIDNEFYTIDTRNLDLDLVKGLHLNYIRETVFSIFQDLDQLVKQTINLDQRFQKDKERAREMDIPQLGNVFSGGKS